MKTALVIAAHPDDEVLGCGGTIARMTDDGWAVDILILAEGATSRSPTRDLSGSLGVRSELAVCSKNAARILGARATTIAGFPDNRMDERPLLDVVKRIEAAIRETHPRRVLTHCSSDVNVDHRITHDAVIAATRPVPGSIVRELLFFEIPSSTEWRPPASLPGFQASVYVDIQATLDRKKLALDVYASEMRPFPHPRSIEAIEHLARWRGATVGLGAAEAFEAGRLIV